MQFGDWKKYYNIDYNDHEKAPKYTVWKKTSRRRCWSALGKGWQAAR